METAAKNTAAAGEKPAKKVSVSYHPELRGMHAQGRKQPGTGMAPAGPQGRFPDGWQAKQAPKHAMRHSGAGGDAGQHREYRKDRKEGRGGRNAMGARHAAYGKDMRRSPVPGYHAHDAIQPKHDFCWGEEYSSTCCGKCKHHMRVWGARVWVCDNSGSEKHGFPTDYGNTCACFERDDR